MSVKTEIWVSAYLRRCFANNLFGAVMRRGAAEAGALYVIADLLDGRVQLYGPPPGPVYGEDGERRWVALLRAPAPRAEALAVLERRRKYDPDLWIVDIEDRQGTALLNIETDDQP